MANIQIDREVDKGDEATEVNLFFLSALQSYFSASPLTYDRRILGNQFNLFQDTSELGNV